MISFATIGNFAVRFVEIPIRVAYSFLVANDFLKRTDFLLTLNMYFFSANFRNHFLMCMIYNKICEHRTYFLKALMFIMSFIFLLLRSRNMLLNIARYTGFTKLCYAFFQVRDLQKKMQHVENELDNILEKLGATNVKLDEKDKAYQLVRIGTKTYIISVIMY